MSSPTSRTLERLREDGWTADVVERFNSFTKRRNDFMGFADIVCCHPEHGTIAIQATSGSNVSARLAKLKAEPRVAVWLLAGHGHHAVEVWGWDLKPLRRGAKAKRWQVRRVQVTFQDIIQNAKETA